MTIPCTRGMSRGGRVQLAIGAAGVLASALFVDRDRVGPRETAAFRLINDMPDALTRPVWFVMQCGALGAVPAAAGISSAAGHPELARRLLASGSATWAVAKLVKRVIRRPRPAELLPAVRCRGVAASGLGFVSGHAGVAAALSAAVFPCLAGWARPALAALAPVGGASRIFVGAHLPLDVVGGAALGLVVDAVTAPWVATG